MVFNVDREHLLASRIQIAGTSKSRKQGLMGVEQLESGAGIWIAPCEAIHSFAMKMPIDVVFLDRERRIRKLIAALPPWRLAFSLVAHSVLELEAGAISRSGTCLGDRLRFTPVCEH